MQLIKEGLATRFIVDVDMGRLIIHLTQVEEYKMKDREEFKDKRAKKLDNQLWEQMNGTNS